jgi:orotidine 5'-phosphate decarboxylase subfamily 1
MLSFFKRANLTLHPLAQKLFKLMEQKKSNLAIALDVIEQKRLLALADLLGPEICTLKTHVDILKDFTPDFGEKLRALAHRHQFLIFEDRKFADIGQTVALQYEQGIYRISEWADLVNAHIVPGPGIIEGLKSVGKPLNRGLLLLAEMSSSGTLAHGDYTKEAVAMGESQEDFVMGFISLRKVSQNPGMIHFTPGVKLNQGSDALGQRYRTIEEILEQNKSDVIIVGRDITHAQEPLSMAKLYRQRAWECYTKHL